MIHPEFGLEPLVIMYSPPYVHLLWGINLQSLVSFLHHEPFQGTSLTRGIVIAAVLFMFGILFLRRYVKLDWSTMGNRISTYQGRTCIFVDTDIEPTDPGADSSLWRLVFDRSPSREFLVITLVAIAILLQNNPTDEYYTNKEAMRVTM